MFLTSIAILATIFTIWSYLSPWTVIHKANERYANRVNLYTYLIQTLSCFIWSYYGVYIEDVLLALSSFVGVFLSLFYIFKLRHFTEKTLLTGMAKVSLGILMLLFIWMFYVQEYLPDAEAITHLGIACALLSVMLSAVPMAGSVEVVRQRDSSRQMPFEVVLSSFMSSVFWFLYGVLTEDIWLSFASLVGSLLAGVQLILFIVFPPPTSAPSTSPSVLIDRTWTLWKKILFSPKHESELPLQSADSLEMIDSPSSPSSFPSSSPSPPPPSPS